VRLRCSLLGPTRCGRFRTELCMRATETVACMTQLRSNLLRQTREGVSEPS